MEINALKVQDKINNTSWVFETLSDMKANSNDFKSGDIVKILGYFSSGDEGEGYFLIKTKQTSEVADDCSIVSLNNQNLVAELIFEGEINVRQFGVKADGNTTDTLEINKAIKFLAKKGGGILKGIKNGVSILDGSVFLVSNIRYEFFNYTLQGKNKNFSLVETGYYDSDSDTVKSNVTEHGQGTTGNGEHYVENMTLEGCTFKNGLEGVRGHRLNYNTCIQNCVFDNTLNGYSVRICHSWAFVFRMNYVRQKAYFFDFADWTLIENNSFEGKEETYTTGLTIGEGSYSCKIMSNGFHSFTKAGIKISNECRDTEISNCHFEGNAVGILNEDSSGIITNISIHNNWFLAGTFGTNSSAISMKTAISCEFKQNTFSGDWQYIYQLNGTTNYGNTIYLSDSEYYESIPENLNIGRGTVVKLQASNNSGTMLPQIENLSNGNYSAETFLKKHIFVDNNVPMCTVTKVGTNQIAVDTFVTSSDTFISQEVVFYNFLIYPNGKSRTYQMAGFIVNNKITELFNNTLGGTYDTMTIIPSNNNGKLRLLITNAVHNLETVQGFVKQL